MPAFETDPNQKEMPHIYINAMVNLDESYDIDFAELNEFCWQLNEEYVEEEISIVLEKDPDGGFVLQAKFVEDDLDKDDIIKADQEIIQLTDKLHDFAVIRNQRILTKEEYAEQDTIGYRIRYLRRWVHASEDGLEFEDEAEELSFTLNVLDQLGMKNKTQYKVTVEKIQ